MESTTAYPLCERLLRQADIESDRGLVDKLKTRVGALEHRIEDIRDQRVKHVMYTRGLEIRIDELELLFAEEREARIKFETLNTWLEDQARALVAAAGLPVAVADELPPGAYERLVRGNGIDRPDEYEPVEENSKCP